MTATIEERALVVIVTAEEPGEPCQDNPVGTCTRQALWSPVWTPDCGHNWVLCQQHRAEADEYMRKHGSSFLACSHCGVLSDFVRWEPIGRGR